MDEGSDSSIWHRLAKIFHNNQIDAVEQAIREASEDWLRGAVQCVSIDTGGVSPHTSETCFRCISALCRWLLSFAITIQYSDNTIN